MGSFTNGVYVPTIGEVGWGTNVNDFLTRSGEEYVNVKQLPYGAKGDGVTDDTAAIQAALAAGAGRAIYFPPGTYLIAPGNSRATALQVASGTTVYGAAGGGSVIKIKNSASNYGSIFWGTTAAENDIMIRDLKVDQNPSGNTGLDCLIGVQNVIRAEGGSRWRVENMTFDPCTGVNTVTAAGSGDHHSVRGCYFRFVQCGTSANYDNSAIYLESDTHSVTGCWFEATLAQQARGCIETHGGHSTITGNMSKGYETLVNVVSRDPGLAAFTNGNEIVVANNSVVDCLFGVALWAANPTYPLQNVTITGNAIHVNNADRGSAGRQTYDDHYAIGWPFNSYDTKNVIIANNAITMQAEERSYASGQSGDLSAGIRLNGNGNIDGVVITGNTILNAPVGGIRIIQGGGGKSITRVRVAHNIIIDAGNNSICGHAASRSGIFAGNTLADVAIHDNTIVDTGAGALNGLYGMNLFNSGTGLKAYDNHFAAAFGFLTPDYGTNWGTQDDILTLTDAATVNTYASRGRIFKLSAGGSRTIAAPAVPRLNQLITYDILNNTGGAITTTWNAVFKLGGAWVDPATTKRRTISFYYDGTNWVETGRTAGDI